MKKWLILAAGVWAGTAMAQQPGPMTHAALQAVDEVGESAWVEELPFTIQGVVLNDPEEMLDYSYAPGAEMPPKGGQYQMFIQAVGAGDRGGRRCMWPNAAYPCLRIILMRRAGRMNCSGSCLMGRGASFARATWWR